MLTEKNGYSLCASRRNAAEASGGKSSPVIYTLFKKVLLDLELNGALLDFGAGKGALTETILLLDRFDSITAADLMLPPSDLPKQINWIAADLNEPLELPGCVFDVIIAAEVIEHLENPRALAREWFRLLRPNGKLILSTPNNESWRSFLTLLFRGQYALFQSADYPAHITPLLRCDIERCLTEAGFENPVFLFTDSGSCPGFPDLRWQDLSYGLLKGVRYSDNLLAITSKPHNS
ncbi:MAG: methyltransferase domain-containing protein [Acidobacteria bacterium]|nr:methyltransferase domain-containing protein [Acidobacteriota bacterium]